MAKKELTPKEKNAQMTEWKLRLEGLDRLLQSCPDLEGYQEEDWVWVKGDTKPHKDELKFYGLRFCTKKGSPHYQHWYLAAPRWFTEERRAREAAEMARMAAENSLGGGSALEQAANLVGHLTSSIEGLKLNCDAEVYETLRRVEELLIESL